MLLLLHRLTQVEEIEAFGKALVIVERVVCCALDAASFGVVHLRLSRVHPASPTTINSAVVNRAIQLADSSRLIYSAVRLLPSVG